MLRLGQAPGLSDRPAAVIPQAQTKDLPHHSTTMNSDFHSLPPAPRLCRICAIDHPPEQPHNPQSFYYQHHFNQGHGRLPTWADALAHCSDEIKTPWLDFLGRLGIDLNSSDVIGGLTSNDELNSRLEANP